MFLRLGIVGRALGLQGFFYISGRDEPFPANIKTIKIGSSQETAKQAEILSVGWQKDRPFIRCTLAYDRTAAELLIGMGIWGNATDIQVDDSTEYLLKDLVGRDVIDSSGVLMGKIIDVVKLPASINLNVLNPAGSAELEIPMIATYVNMNFYRGGTAIQLVVDASTFEDIWNIRPKK